MRRIECLRREHRKNLIHEIFLGQLDVSDRQAVLIDHQYLILAKLIA